MPMIFLKFYSENKIFVNCNSYFIKWIKNGTCFINQTLFLFITQLSDFFGIDLMFDKTGMMSSLIALIFVCYCKIIDRTSNHFEMKINTTYYGIPKQLYHTSYSPLQNSRSSSLNINPTFPHPIAPPNSISRQDSSKPILMMANISRNSLSTSQATQQQHKMKMSPHDYYPKTMSYEDMLAQIQQKMEDLQGKVSKNTEDIKHIKQKQKSSQPLKEIQKRIFEQIQKIEQKQALFNEECLLKIVSVKEELCQISSKLSYQQTEINEKLSFPKNDEKILIKTRNLIEERIKQETAKIRLIIQNQTNKLAHQLKWEISKENHPNHIKSKLKYPFKPIKLNYSEFIQAIQTQSKNKERMSTRQSSESPRSGRYLFSEEKVYYIDKDGYLLDEDNYYLLDEKENMIRLNQGMLSQLRKQGILKQ